MIPMKACPSIFIPVLHDVVIREGVFFHKKEYDEINKWCSDNCKEPYYIFPNWTHKVGAQFEDDEDATMFALRWM